MEGRGERMEFCRAVAGEMEFLGEGFRSVPGAVLHRWLSQAPCTKCEPG